MTENAERPSERRLGQDEEQETLYSPSGYGPLDPSRRGRWFVLGGSAVVWTDDEDGAGVAWTRQSPESQEAWQHLQVSSSAGVPAGVAYQLALRIAGDSAGEEQSGELHGAEEAFEALSGEG